MSGDDPVLLDARLATYRRGGIPRYIEALALHLPAVAPDLPVRFLLNRVAAGWSARDDVRRVRTPPHFRWERRALGREIRRLRPCLVHSPDFVAPRTAAPTVVTIHDLAFLHRPELLAAAARRYYGQTAASARDARRVIAVSHYTAEQARELLDIPRSKIVVIPNGVEPPTTISGEEAARIVAQELGPAAARFLHRGAPVALAVGTIEPRKRIDLLVEAIELLDSRDMSLVLVGQAGWRAERTLDAIQAAQHAGRAIWLADVSDRALDALYRLATLLALPSLDEGFGLPALEALARGLPVLAARSGALPEVLGDAARFVADPAPEAWAKALRALACDVPGRHLLTERGLARAGTLSWAATARQTAAVYREVLSE